jgi:hypothetical protein
MESEDLRGRLRDRLLIDEISETHLLNSMIALLNTAAGSISQTWLPWLEPIKSGTTYDGGTIKSIKTPIPNLVRKAKLTDRVNSASIRQMMGHFGRIPVAKSRSTLRSKPGHRIAAVAFHGSIIRLHGPLRSGVRRDARPREFALHGGDVDDLATATSDHVAGDGLADIEHARNIGGEQLLPFFDRKVLERRAELHTGIVDQDIDRTEISLNLARVAGKLDRKVSR